MKVEPTHIKRKSLWFWLNKNKNFNKNATESKMENPTHEEKKQVSPSLSLVSSSVLFGNFTSNIGGGDLYVFRKASFKTYVINSYF